MLKRGEQVKAAKPHQCKWCGEQIEKGMYYYFWTVHLGNGYERNRLHDECYGHYRRIGMSHFVPFINKRHVTEEEIQEMEESSGKDFTIFVRRQLTLKATHDEMRSTLVHSDLFVCRVKAANSSSANMRAMKQALAYDTNIYETDPKNLYKTKPVLGHYDVIQTFSGFPSLIRPV